MSPLLGKYMHYKGYNLALFSWIFLHPEPDFAWRYPAAHRHLLGAR